MENVIQEVLESTQNAIRKAARAVKQNNATADSVLAFAKLIDSFVKLFELTKPQPEGSNYYEELEAECMKENEAFKKKKLNKRKR